MKKEHVLYFMGVIYSFFLLVGCSNTEETEPVLSVPVSSVTPTQTFSPIEETFLVETTPQANVIREEPLITDKPAIEDSEDEGEDTASILGRVLLKLAQKYCDDAKWSPHSRLSDFMDKETFLSLGLELYCNVEKYWEDIYVSGRCGDAIYFVPNTAHPVYYQWRFDWYGELDNEGISVPPYKVYIVYSYNLVTRETREVFRMSREYYLWEILSFIVADENNIFYIIDNSHEGGGNKDPHYDYRLYKVNLCNGEQFMCNVSEDNDMNEFLLGSEHIDLIKDIGAGNLLIFINDSEPPMHKTTYNILIYTDGNIIRLGEYTY